MISEKYWKLCFWIIILPCKVLPLFLPAPPPHPGVESLTWLFHFVIPQLNLLRSPELTPLRSPLNSLGKPPFTPFKAGALVCSRYASRTIQGEECHWTVSDNSPSQPASKTPRLPLEAYEAPLVFLNKPGLTILYVYAAFLEFDLSRLDFLSFLFCCWRFRFCHRLGQKMAKLMLNSRIRLLQSVQHPSRPLGADKACPHTWARPTWWGATTRAPAVQEARTDTPTPLYLPPPFPVRFRFDVHFGHYNPWQHPSFRCIWPRLCC